MPQFATCPNGHRWLSSDDDAGGGCPQCGETKTIMSGDSEGFDQLPPIPERLPSQPSSLSDPIPLERFVENLSSSGLMSKEDVEAFSDSLPDDQRPHDAGQLARALVRRNRITEFQAEALCDESPEPLVLDDYVLLEKIGQGAMGQVFKAQHRRMHRLVALKLLPLVTSMRPGAVARFEQEASTTARLEHPNIVTVYEFGSCGGRHYYVMKYVQGQSLAELIRSGPADNATAARIMEPVSRAVQAAHERGVLHRDLKPQNILIDREAHPEVVDFGLAKLLEGQDELTRTGEIMGTPSFMSPEQARDTAHVTPATDIYSLGATLYYLLSGRAPFQAATPLETLRQVVDEEAVPLRRLNPSVHVDLETICMKCMEREPGRRYSSAQQVAEELRRFGEGVPIESRPVSRVERAWRWCRRNPKLAASLISAVSFLVLALVATTVGYVQTSIAREEAEAGHRDARAAVHDFFTRVSEETLLNQPGMHGLKEDLLRRALDYFERFLVRRGDDPELRGELATTYYRAGLITAEIGSPEQALEYFRQSRGIHRELVGPDSETEQAGNIADTWNAQGQVLTKVGDLDGALEAYEAARQLRQRVADADPSDTSAARVLANAIMNLGVTRKNLALEDLSDRRLEQARYNLEQAQEIRLRLIDQAPDNPRLLRDMGLGYYNLGNLDQSLANNSAAKQRFVEAKEVFAQLLAQNPLHLNDRYRTVLCLRVIGDLETDVAAALRAYQEALGHMQVLAARNPDVNEYQQELARIWMNTGLRQYQLQEWSAAASSYHEAIELLTELRDKDPDRREYRSDLATSRLTLAKISVVQEQWQEANDLLKVAHADFESLDNGDAEASAFTEELYEAIELSRLIQATQREVRSEVDNDRGADF